MSNITLDNKMKKNCGVPDCEIKPALKIKVVTFYVEGAHGWSNLRKNVIVKPMLILQSLLML